MFGILHRKSGESHIDEIDTFLGSIHPEPYLLVQIPQGIQICGGRGPQRLLLLIRSSRSITFDQTPKNAFDLQRHQKSTLNLMWPPDDDDDDDPPPHR